MSAVQVDPCPPFAIADAMGALAKTDHRQGCIPVYRL